MAGLLAAMFSLSVRFVPAQDSTPHGDGDLSPPGTPEEYLDRAIQYCYEALDELEDTEPPLGLLQALILATYSQSIRGIRARAWRSLGLCVRIAHELGLHQIDEQRLKDGKDQEIVTQEQWMQDEEKRRAFWAIWEMDAFAAITRGLPPTFCLSTISTQLPSQDEFSLRGDAHRSCILNPEITQRLDGVLLSKSRSAAVWRILISSLALDAHSIEIKPKSTHDGETMDIIRNTLLCVIASIPKELQYAGEGLQFSSRRGYSRQHNAQLDRDRYDLVMVIQFTRLKLCQHERVYCRESQPYTRDTESISIEDEADSTTSGTLLSQHLNIAESVLDLVRNCPPNHVQDVNPFYAGLVAVAATVFIRCIMSRPEGRSTVLWKSNVQVLRMIDQQFQNFWSTPPNLFMGLDEMQRLASLTRTMPNTFPLGVTFL